MEPPEVPEMIEGIEREIIEAGVNVGWDEVADLTEAKELLQEADLLQPAAAGADGDDDDDAHADDASGGRRRLTRTRDALRFLLQPTHLQVWKLVRAYMELAERGHPGTRHATLCFLLRLGLLRLGKPYRLDDASLDEAQRDKLGIRTAMLGLPSGRWTPAGVLGLLLAACGCAQLDEHPCFAEMLKACRTAHRDELLERGGSRF